MIRVLLLLLFISGGAQAQIVPTEAELAAYEGLHRAAAVGDVGAIERLHDASADSNARDAFGRTPLHIAAYTGQREAALTLVRRGANPRAFDFDRFDPLTVAAARGDHAMVALLLWLGADPAAVIGREDRTALIAAARGGHAEIVRELVAAGAAVNWVSSLGWTALMEAVIFGDRTPRTVATVQALLDMGAKARYVDWSGTTVLRVARVAGNDAVADLLIAAGAD